MPASTDPITELLERVEGLPPAPKLLPQLLAALSDLDAEIDSVVQLITYDPALTAKVLQVSNSAYYALPSRVSTVDEAVNRLGFHGIYTIVAMASSQVFMKTPQSAVDADALWRHLVSSAFAAQSLARKVRGDASMLFTAGLLHDIGKLILAEVLQDDYGQLVTDQVLCGRGFAALESGSFGMNHAEVAGRLLESWDFAPSFVAAVKFHHDCVAAGDDAPLAACLELADAVAHSLAVPDGPPFGHLDLDAPLEIAGVSLDDLLDEREKVQGKAEMIDAMCASMG